MYISVILIILFFIVLYLYTGNYTYTKSRVDGKLYKTKNNHLAQQSADILAQININILKLISHIKSQQNQPEYAQRLYTFNPHAIEENILDIDTSYTLNKGSYVVFCVSSRDKANNKIYDINTLMYVAIHELAHIVSLSVGHTEEFKQNFKSLLKYAIDIKIYSYVDYSSSPQEYCGISINKNVLN